MTVAEVVTGFAKALPEATVYVFDNNSTDRTAECALSAGAVVRHVDLPGKANVVRRMFADVDADCYVLVDGDATYDPGTARELVEKVLVEGFDLANGAREPVKDAAFRRGHTFGNRLLGGLLGRLFGRPVGDVLSGYKACSRRLVKSFPVLSAGFEVESELMVHALMLHAKVTEVRTAYKERPPGSESKLGTYSDGIRILHTIINLVRQGRPLAFFSLAALVFAVAGLALGIPVLVTFLHTHKVPRLPTAVLATGLEILAALSLTAGLVLDTVSRSRREHRILVYLSHRAPDLPSGQAGHGTGVPEPSNPPSGSMSDAEGRQAEGDG